MTSGGVTSGAAKAGRESALMATWGDQGRRGSLGHTHGQLLGLCAAGNGANADVQLLTGHLRVPEVR